MQLIQPDYEYDCKNFISLDDLKVFLKEEQVEYNFFIEWVRLKCPLYNRFSEYSSCSQDTEDDERIEYRLHGYYILSQVTNIIQDNAIKVRAKRIKANEPVDYVFYGTNFQCILKVNTVEVHEAASYKQTFLHIADIDKVQKSLGLSLYDFSQLLEKKANDKSNDSISTKEYNSMLGVILAMAIDRYGFKLGEPKNKATGEGEASIKASCERVGIYVTSKTIKSYLDKAYKIHPDSIDQNRK